MIKKFESLKNESFAAMKTLIFPLKLKNGTELLTKNSSIKSLNNDVKNKLIQYIEKNIENGEDLRQKLTQNYEHKIKIKCYKGQRSKLKLPRRGQRTHTNSKTTKKL